MPQNRTDCLKPAPYPHPDIYDFTDWQQFEKNVAGWAEERLQNISKNNRGASTDSGRSQNTHSQTDSPI